MAENRPSSDELSQYLDQAEGNLPKVEPLPPTPEPVIVINPENPDPTRNQALNEIADLHEHANRSISSLEKILVNSSEQVRQNETVRLRDTLEQTATWGRYLAEQDQIEFVAEELRTQMTRAGEMLKVYEDQQEAGKLVDPKDRRSLERAVDKSVSAYRNYVQRNIPREMRNESDGSSHVDGKSPEGKEYLEKVEGWKKTAEEGRRKIQAEREEEKDPKKAINNLRGELTNEVAARQQAEREAAQLREQLRLANEAIETERKRADAAVEAARILREQAADGTLPEIKSANERAEAAEARVRELENASATPVNEEPELEMENLEVAPVDTRKRLERIRDGVANGVRAWFHNLDPRGRDWLWRIGAVAGIGEAIWASSAFPGGRLVAPGLNLLAAQGVGLSVEGLRRAEIAHARGQFEDNDLVQRILDINDRHKVASDRTKNFFAGLSAGMTVGSIGTALYGAVEGFVAPHPAIATETAVNKITGKAAATAATEAVKATDIFNPTITIPDHGNFWSAWHINSSFAPDWSDLSNGTTHTDVIKDMVIKLARANGHELGLVHAGDQIRFSEILTPGQIELVKKAAAAKSYGEYTTAIKPAYHVLLGK